MFSNLTYDDKVAFFDLLDEYFESRPHLLGGGGGGGGHVTSPVASASSNSRTLPPMAPPIAAGRTLPPMQSPTSPPPRAPSAGGGGFGFGQQQQSGEKPDMATRMIMGGLKMGTSGARTGLGMLSKNQAAMDALGKVGAAAIVNSAHGSLNRAGGPQQQQGQGQEASPTSPSAGMAGMNMSGPPPARGGAPPRRAAAPVAAAEMGQARALYDYDASDGGDLGVKEGQVIYVSQKTSADWWTCEDANGRKGLVPSAYLKEL
ncbi:uncharacterized protein MKK02DRAFT_32704 [Dioszegia hungarica]|uniref:SH3 domain-containing protein n=1 Tax=Dioszegia hungarica TaxID=4972 RepID=A0AA38LU01_9TREE|nr:uncharacterized protein MKK02DRAFT_32704 [Dioszegia hungarica]KAI9635235.1 hypothetical protein MKK02DRAFT_32704 [Dioszegia hungarica]